MKKLFFFFALLAVGIAGFAILFSGHEASGAVVALSPLLANMSREELEQFADNALSDSYEGDELYEGFDDLDDDDMYDGYDDPMVSFLGNSRSFLDEKKSGVYLTFVIVNNSGYSKTVCLNPAYFETQGLSILSGTANNTTVLMGNPIDLVTAVKANNYLGLNNTCINDMVAAGHSEIEAVIADGVIFGTSAAGITVTGVNGKIMDHLHFVKKNATRIPELVFSSVNASTGAVDTTFYSKIMTIRQVSPYRKFGDTNIDLNEFFKVEQFQSGKITVDTHNYGMQADDQTLIFVQIDNNIRLTVTMKIGGIGNAAQAIYKKAGKAKKNIVQGTAGVVPVPARKAMKAVRNKQMNLIRKTLLKRK